jgi:hypothetical protein
MASTRLSRTPSSTGNRQIFTQSFWCKIADPSGTKTLAGIYDDSNNYNYCYLDSGALKLYWKASGSLTAQLNTNRLFRDVGAFYHIVYSVDTTQATSSNRIKLYINGVQETSFSTATYPSQNRYTEVNANNITHHIGSLDGSSQYFDGLMTYVAHVDGTAYDASYFGETDSTSGIWKPKTSPSVTWGTNGFLLKFENSGAMGTDSSGNSNTFTVNGTLTQTEDTPSNNFATLNTLQGAIASGLTLINGNLTIDGSPSTTAWRSLPATLGVSTGKWYYEVKVKNLADNVRIGLVDVDQAQQLNGYFNNLSRGYAYNNSGEKSNNNSSASYGNSYTTNDIIGVAMDLDNSKLYFSKNGVFQNSGDPTSGSTGTGSAYDISSGYTYAPCVATYQPTDKLECNFGQGYFGTTAVSSANADDGGLGIMEYDVPANYRVLCTKNIKNYG